MNGTILFTAAGKIQGRILWSSVGDTTTNSSTVTTTLQVHRTNTSTTTGKSWTGSVKVGSNTTHNFPGFNSSVSVNENWTTLETYTDTVEHDADGTCKVIISGSVTGPSGTSQAGYTSSGSESVELEDLFVHTPPSNITYTMTETNQKLVNAGIPNNLIIENLSVKSFDIGYTLHDSATPIRIGIYNRITPYYGTTNPFVLDFSEVTLVKWLDDETKIPITAFVRDSFETQGTSKDASDWDLYDYITYTKLNLIETSTTAKRSGQISGKAKLNITGNYHNGIIGNINQSGTYKPTIKYKFWKAGTTEPATFDYTIPSSNITIQNGSFVVSGYDIGSTNETATNYFNPEFAYRVKVLVEDNFTSYTSQEKSIPVGKATWTEYKDRVEFEKIVVKGDVYANGAKIVDMGENENGTWIKFSNGIMICNGYYTGTTTLSAYWSQFDRTNEKIPVTFPMEFTEVYSVQTTPEYYCYLFAVLICEINETNFTFTGLKPKSTGSKTIKFWYTAIGRWK